MATHLNLFSLQVIKNKQHLSTAQSIIKCHLIAQRKSNRKKQHTLFLSVSNIFLRAAKTLSEQFLEFQKFPASSEITNLVITCVLLKQTEHLNLKRKRTKDRKPPKGTGSFPSPYMLEHNHFSPRFHHVIQTVFKNRIKSSAGILIINRRKLQLESNSNT